MNRPFLALVLAGIVFLPRGAEAQSAPPIGYWSNANETEQLYVGADAQCTFAAAGAAPWGGPCSWNATYSGGILTIVNQSAYQPAPVYFNVTWVDAGTISLEGDILTRRQ